MTPANFKLAIDLLVILIGIVAMWFAIKAAVGGLFGRGMTFIIAGIFVLAVNHALDTLYLSKALTAAGHTKDLLQPTIVHRLINLVGFVLMVFGFFTFSKTRS